MKEKIHANNVIIWQNIILSTGVVLALILNELDNMINSFITKIGASRPQIIPKLEKFSVGTDINFQSLYLSQC